jgi:hypothetical protein
MKLILKALSMLISLALVTSTAFAQEMIHAVSGTVTALNANTGTFQINTDDGSSGTFKWQKTLSTPIAFDKSVRADSASPEDLKTTGAHVIVFYFGQGDIRTAVAVHNLGAGQVKAVNGTVVKFDRHDHTIVVKDNSGTEQTIHLDPKTVGDTMMGVMQDYKFDYNKGDSVVVTATQSGGNETAALIEPAA